MELAIPLIALGSVYLISNQRRESFRTQTLTTKESAFQIPPAPQNTVIDMAGRNVDRNFIASGMVPFLGKQKSIGMQLRDQSEQTLDTYTGAGSLQVNKKEVSPLFSPEDNVQWANGSPNQTEFYRSRQNPAMNTHNVKPFESQRVGPGLNQGYESSGSGGFNSGMEARDTWLDKTVDQLRVDTNPKSSFSLVGHEGPTQTLVKNLGMEGAMEKRLPDKFFTNTPERYFTTTGQSGEAATLRSIQPAPTIHRATTSQPYAGVAASTVSPVVSSKQRGLVEMDHRQQLPSLALGGATSYARSNLDAKSEAYVKYGNNRTVAPLAIGGMSSLISAITAPLTDILRPSRKENTLYAKQAGNIGGSIAPPINNDKVSTTIRDTTTFSPYERGQRPFLPTDSHFQAPQQPVQVQRDTTTVSYTGIGTMLPAPASYEAGYNATIETSRANGGRTAGGSMQTFEPFINQRNNDKQHPAYLGSASPMNQIPTGKHRIETRAPQVYADVDRNSGDLLQAFKQNPYTQSLQSVA